jgi:hypothetical protein
MELAEEEADYLIFGFQSVRNTARLKICLQTVITQGHFVKVNYTRSMLYIWKTLSLYPTQESFMGNIGIGFCICKSVDAMVSGLFSVIPIT